MRPGFHPGYPNAVGHLRRELHGYIGTHKSPAHNRNIAGQPTSTDR